MTNGERDRDEQPFVIWHSSFDFGYVVLMFMFSEAFGSLDVVLQGENRQDHADEDCADERRDEEQHQWLRQRNCGLELPIQIPFGDVGDANQFLIEFSAFL